MKKFILIIAFSLLTANVYAEYIHIDHPQEIMGRLPQSLNYSDGVTSNGNFRQLALRDPDLMKSEGFREITVDNSASFDSEIQTAGVFTVVVFADHAEKSRIITNKTLGTVKTEKGRKIIAEGRAVLTAKYSFDWEAGYDADKTTLKNYFTNTIKPLIAGGTIQSIKDLNNGDEYTWPTL
jgi:hypothetical protein